MSARKNKLSEQYQRARAKLCEVFHENMGYVVDDYAGAALADVHIMRETGTLDMVLDHKWATAPDVDNADGAAEKRVRVPAESRVYVHFAPGKTSAKSLHATLAALFAAQGFTQADTLVLVLAPDKVKVVAGGSKAVRAALDEIWELSGYHLVVHDLKHLQYNALQHQDQPQGLRVLGAEEKAAFLEQTRIHPNDLPKISRQDVVAALLCARVGDIVYGERSSPTTILAPFWRIVTTDAIGPKSTSKSGGTVAAAAEKAAGHA